MNFYPIEPTKPVREEFLSEDKNFRLVIDRSVSRYGRYAISTLQLEMLPGFGCGETIIAAMAKAKKSLIGQIAVMQERIEQLDKMIAEEMCKETTQDEVD